MFDQIVLVKIMEMQNEADRQRWRKDEGAFYRDLDCQFWRNLFRLYTFARRGLFFNSARQKRQRQAGDTHCDVDHHAAR